MRQLAGIIILMMFWMLGLTTILSAQQPGVHYWDQGSVPPGAIGTRQLTRGGPLPGFFQPVEIKSPVGASLSLASEGRFDESQSDTRKVGLLIGAVYRLRVTGIRFAEGLEVFPTIEVIDRTYAPVGMELRFPIPIELTEEELKMALDGKYVTRVIYLEDPRNALPVRESSKSQSWFEVQPGQDPVAVADSLGRPVAILRIGGRVPEMSESPDPKFFFGCPPYVQFPAEPVKTAVKDLPKPTQVKFESPVKIESSLQLETPETIKAPVEKEKPAVKLLPAPTRKLPVNPAHDILEGLKS